MSVLPHLMALLCFLFHSQPVSLGVETHFANAKGFPSWRTDINYPGPNRNQATKRTV